MEQIDFFADLIVEIQRYINNNVDGCRRVVEIRLMRELNLLTLRTRTNILHSKLIS